ncbi:MAG: efflux RND transporter permease subunit [Planctomycetota bacterium]|nr:efflux RND transporter permease subunit [Planctomycetota bacterium]
MWIVRLALRRPYTFVVASILVAILGGVSILRMPTDIFPNIDIPVISLIFNYGGMTPDDMETRVVGQIERFLTTTVNDIEHIESLSLNGVGVIKVYLQPGAKVEAATAQLTAVSQTAIRNMPPGSQPPLIIRYSASNVPIVQISLGSDTLSEQQVFDAAVNALRPQLVTIPGVQIPFPYGGKQRNIMVDIDPEKLYAWGISPSEVSDAINAQNVILPSGTSKIGDQEYAIRFNGSPAVPADLNNVPLKTVRGTVIYVRDVAHVRDGFSVQTNVVHVGGKPGVLLSVLKSGGASTLDVISALRAKLEFLKNDPKLAGVKIDLLFDQSIFVRAAVEGVVKEALIAAGLTGLMILLFLGSWRSTIIVMISIPLSILVSIITLYMLGETLNVMTLGGMALAVGILVDDATVEIENIHRNLHQRKRLVQAILDGAQQIAVPAFVSTLCICIVFVPVVFISGAARYLFTPLAMSVVFAMMTSYLLSRTLVPTMVHYLLAPEVEMYGGQLDPNDPHAAKAIAAHEGKAAEQGRAGRFMSTRAGKSIIAIVTAVVVGGLYGLDLKTGWLGGYAAVLRAWVVGHPREAVALLLALVASALLLHLIARYQLIWRVHAIFNRGFEKLRRGYGGVLVWALAHRLAIVGGFAVLVVGSCFLLPYVGRDFFPSVDAGKIRLHVRAPPGTRIEKTQHEFAAVAQAIRATIPADQIDTMLDNIGIPYSGLNLSLSDGTAISPADGEILVSLTPEHTSTPEHVRKLRKVLTKQFPHLIFFFQPPDIVTQVLNFGLPAPIDIQVAGNNREKNYALALKIKDDLAAVPGAVDMRLQQVARTPDIRLEIDRTMARQVGVTARDIAGDVLISLSSSGQTAPNFWLDPRSGVTYNVLVQTPQYKMDSISDLETSPVRAVTAGGGPAQYQLLGNLTTLSRGYSITNATHYDISPTFDVHLGVQGTDLGSVSKGVNEIVAKYNNPQSLAPGSRITVRGQAESMRTSFIGLGYGLIFAIVLVYLLMVVNFQSWLDPLIILMALPGALVGIIWMLYATCTTISVPALMGATMSIGVATANSILMITFANDQRKLGMNARDAALAAGLTRLRPVVMTALAMIIGMLPMSLGLGEGGEQNAPLGRAVIGGLAFATFATLLFVPVVYSALRGQAPQTQVEEELK